MFPEKEYTMELSGKVSQMLCQAVLEAKGINKRRLSIELGLSSSHVWKIFEGQRHLTAEVALRLEKFTDIPAYDWLKLQAEDDLNSELKKSKGKLIDFPLPKSFLERLHLQGFELDVDDVLSLKKGDVSASHEVTAPIAIAFDGNIETNLELLNNYEPCWVEKAFHSNEKVKLAKIVIVFSGMKDKKNYPKDIKVEGKIKDQYENIIFDDVQGSGELQNNDIYIRVVGDRPIECYIKHPAYYEGYKLTMIGAQKKCIVTEFKGYEVKAN